LGTVVAVVVAIRATGAPVTPAERLARAEQLLVDAERVFAVTRASRSRSLRLHNKMKRER